KANTRATTPDIEAPDAFGTIDLVSAHGQQVDVQGVDLDGDLAKRLGSVRMEQDVALPAQASNLCQRLNDTRLVVAMHDRDENGLVRHRRCQPLEIDQAVGAHTEIGDLAPMTLEMLGGIEDGLVLGHQSDDVVAFFTI